MYYLSKSVTVPAMAAIREGREVLEKLEAAIDEGCLQVQTPPPLTHTHTHMHGLFSNTMALLTSDCGAMRLWRDALPEHQMVLITSDCVPFRTTFRSSRT